MALSDYDRLIVQRIQAEAAKYGYEVLDFTYEGTSTAIVDYCDASQEDSRFRDTVELDAAMDLVPGMREAMEARRSQD